jgi:hypothetical protein
MMADTVPLLIVGCVLGLIVAVVGYLVFAAVRAKHGIKAKLSKFTTVSHIIMAGIMLMFFVGVVLGAYATVFLGEAVGTTLDFIMQLALPVGLSYMVKAFGENVVKIAMSMFAQIKNAASVPQQSYQQSQQTSQSVYLHEEAQG